MAELISQNWILFVVALVIGILVAWWLFAATRKTTIEKAPHEEAAAGPARRNQALIDAPPAAAETQAPIAPPVPPPVPGAPGGVGEAIAAATDPVPPAPPPPQSAPASAEAAPEPQPVPQAAPAAPEGTPGDGPDDLTRIKGLGPKLSRQLQDMGVTRFAQIAAWDDAEIDRIDAGLGRFQGRIRRDNWPEQARLLAAGDMAGYESAFGKI